MPLLLAFLALPIVEIALFIWIGGLIGLGWTLLLVVLAAVAGVTVMRVAGLRTFARLREAAGRGVDPVGPMAHQALIFLAGILLVIPGFLTDAVGLLLLVPPVRTLLIGWGASRVTVRVAGMAPQRRPARPGAGDTIEAEFEVVDEARPAVHGGSGWTRPQP